MDIANTYQEKWGSTISNQTIKRILKEAGFRKRRPSKALSTGKSPYREEQFKLIFYFVSLFAQMGHNPVLSIDTKKKERLGNLDRGSQVCSNGTVQVHDHDYSHLSQGKVVPAGIYDTKLNIGYVGIGTNNETAEFIGDNLIHWWEEYGIHQYPDATHLLIFCDCGGANGYRHYAFKKKMLEVARHMALRVQIAHYPPYCSKWNPIEHRLFSQMHRTAKGCLFTSYKQVQKIYQKTSTKAGLKVHVWLTYREYPIGLKVKEDQIDHSRVLKHSELPQFNYTLLP